MSNHFIAIHPKRAFLFAALLFTALSAISQKSPNFIHAIDSLLQQQHAGVQTPGYAVCVVENGRIVYEKYGGMAHIGRQAPVTGQTVFNIGSLSKQFAAACILLLELEGKLKRSDEIHKYIPELPDYGHPITIRQLIGHTSGLRDYLELLIMQNRFKDKWLYNKNMLRYQHKVKSLNFSPGTDFNYSNTGYMMLCLIVERVAGMSLADFAETRIFKPLGMNNAYFQREGVRGVTSGTASYVWQAGKGRYKKEKNYIDAIGATGVHATLRDLVAWDQNFYNNRLGPSGQTLTEMMEQPGTLASGASSFYGAGLFIRKRQGIPEIEHTGGWGEFSAQYRRFPTRSLSVITLTNSNRPSAFRLNDAICDILLPMKPKPAPVSAIAPPQDAVALSGIYATGNNRFLKIASAGSDIFLQIGLDNAGHPRRLHWLAARDDQWTLVDSLENSAVFHRSENGIVGVEWSGGQYFPANNYFEKLQTEGIVDPKTHAGRYKSVDLKRKITVKYRKKSKTLVFKPFPFVRYRLIPVTDVLFRLEGEGYVARFSAGQMTLGDIWNRGIAFKKR